MFRLKLLSLIVLAGLSYADLSTTPLPVTLYVSGCSANGIPVGNDSTGDGSASTPYLTIDKGVSSATAVRNRLFVNGDPASVCDYRAATFTTLAKNIILDSVVAYGASISATTTTGRVILINPAAGTSVYIGKIICDGRGLNPRCIENSASPASPYYVTLNGTELTGFTNYGSWDTQTTNHVNITYNNIVCLGAVTRSCIYHPSIASDGVVIVNGGTLTVTGSNLSSLGAAVHINGVQAGAQASVTGITANITMDASFSGTTATGVRMQNIRGMTLATSTVSIDCSAAVKQCFAVVVAPTDDVNALDTGNFLVDTNVVSVVANSGGSAAGIWNGWDGSTLTSGCYGKLNGGTIRGNTVTGDTAAQTASMHGIVVSCGANTQVYRNLVHHVALAGGKNSNGSYWYDNVFYDMSLHSFQCKGGQSDTVIHNTFYLVSGNTTADGMNATASSETGLACLGLVSTGNIFATDQASPIFTRFDAGSTATLSYDDYYSTNAATSASWRWNGVNQGSLAAWKTASGESTAIAVNPQFVNAGAGNFDVGHTATGLDVVPYTLTVPSDYLGRAFANPLSTAGAYQRQ